jgi:predicted dehydrogenase
MNSRTQNRAATAAAVAPLSFGIVGPGSIAGVFAASLVASGAGRVTAVAGRSPEHAAPFAGRLGARALALDELLGQVDALYVATPHPLHAAAVRAALAARVPVLCEKPLTTDPAETAELFALAERQDTPLVEAWMYRAHPQIARLAALVGSGAIGRVRHVESWFEFALPFDPRHRLYAPELAGGAILDVGGYPVSLALLVAGAAGDTSEPRLANVVRRRAPTGVDAQSSARLVFEGGLLADVHCAVDDERGRGAIVRGDGGFVALHDPFFPGGDRHGRRATLTVESRGHVHTEHLDAPHDCYALEALTFARLVADHRAGTRPATLPAPFVTPADSQRLARLCARWLAD